MTAHPLPPVGPHHDSIQCFMSEPSLFSFHLPLSLIQARSRCLHGSTPPVEAEGCFSYGASADMRWLESTRGIQKQFASCLVPASGTTERVWKSGGEIERKRVIYTEGGR